MGRDEAGYRDVLIYALGLSLTVWVTLHAFAAHSEGLGERAPVKRWSNERQISETVEVTRCGTTVAPGFRAEVAPGIDAKGNPVAPAGSGTEYRTSGLYASVGIENTRVSRDGARKGHKAGHSAEADEVESGGQAGIELEPVPAQDCLLPSK